MNKELPAIDCYITEQFTGGSLKVRSRFGDSIPFLGVDLHHSHHRQELNSRTGKQRDAGQRSGRAGNGWSVLGEP